VRGQVVQFPDRNPHGRWARRFPERAGTDPREDYECWSCGATFIDTPAWYGYDGLCGWCWDATERAERQAEGE
jgi:hypothetical protein